MHNVMILTTKLGNNHQIIMWFDLIYKQLGVEKASFACLFNSKAYGLGLMA